MEEFAVLLSLFGSMAVEKERSDFGCLLRWSGTRICLANFVNKSGFRKLAASQSQVEGN